MRNFLTVLYCSFPSSCNAKHHALYKHVHAQLVSSKFSVTKTYSQDFRHAYAYNSTSLTWPDCFSPSQRLSIRDYKRLLRKGSDSVQVLKSFLVPASTLRMIIGLFVKYAKGRTSRISSLASFKAVLITFMLNQHPTPVCWATERL